MRTTIFYSFRIHGKLLPESDCILYEKNFSYMKIKAKIINLLSDQGYFLREIIRPEIYKHQVSFNFLPNFKAGDIHLIFKPIEFIRPLKNAYNIWVKAEPVKNWDTLPPHPFFEYPRMSSLIEEIWNCLPDNKLAELFSSDNPKVINIFNEKDPFSISIDTLFLRVKCILGE